MGRTGVRSVGEAVELAARLPGRPESGFDGLMGYEGHTLASPTRKPSAWPSAERSAGYWKRGAVERAGLPCRIVSAGGSGSYQ